LFFFVFLAFFVLGSFSWVFFIYNKHKIYAFISKSNKQYM
jgi:hypothetical protein